MLSQRKLEGSRAHREIYDSPWNVLVPAFGLGMTSRLLAELYQLHPCSSMVRIDIPTGFCTDSHIFSQYQPMDILVKVRAIRREVSFMD